VLQRYIDKQTATEGGVLPPLHFDLCLGEGQVEVQFRGPEEKISLFEGPTLYVVSQVAQNHLERKLKPFRNSTSRAIPLDPIRKPLVINWADCQINFQLWVYLTCNRLLGCKAQQFAYSALQKAAGASLLVISELADGQGPVNYETLFEAIGAGLITSKDHLGAISVGH
jgi:hypothetical protein